VDKSSKSPNIDQNKRDFVKKAAYTAPVIMTMAAAPSFAGTGSGQPGQGRPPQQGLPPQSVSIFSPPHGRGTNRDGRSRN